MTALARKPPGPRLVTTVSPSADCAWAALSEKKRQVASDQAALVTLLITNRPEGVSMKTVIETYLIKVKHRLFPKQVIDNALRLGKKGQPPSVSTIQRWVKQYKADGVLGLAKKHSGSKQKVWGWEAVALRYYSLPSKPAIESVSGWLRQDGFETATNSRVRSYLKSLPADLGEYSRKRLGAKLFRDTQKKFNFRDTDDLPVGFIYQGDGHTIDVYLAHPATGKSWRAEMTAWMDIRSRFIVGWFINEAESALTTLFALSHALMEWDHVPAMLHIDNGAGFKSKMVNDKSVGFYSRFHIEPMFSIPGNAKGKGQIERWFRTMEMQFGKRWDTYCGADMAPEVINKIVVAAKAGKTELPSLKQYTDGLTEYVNTYNNTVHSALNGQTPAQLWATLERTPLETPTHAICLPKKEVSVIRETLRFDNRHYTSPALHQFNGTKLVVEYNIHDDSTVRVLSQDGRWLCDADLVKKKAYLPASRIEEAQEKRLIGQQKRLQEKMDETQKRLNNNITHDQVMEEINAFTGELEADNTSSLTEQAMDRIDLISPLLEAEDEVETYEHVELDLTEQ